MQESCVKLTILYGAIHCEACLATLLHTSFAEKLHYVTQP
jgi:hypothetical protein